MCSRDVDALNDYLHGSNSKSVSDSVISYKLCLNSSLILFHEEMESSHSLLNSLLYLQIEEDDVTNAAYGSDGSFFASDTVSVPGII